MDPRISTTNALSRYFHKSLPYGTGPGTDTDLVSVMNGEGNRRFDEVFVFVFDEVFVFVLDEVFVFVFAFEVFVFKFALFPEPFFQYISFTTIGKDPKDPNLVSSHKIIRSIKGILCVK